MPTANGRGSPIPFTVNKTLWSFPATFDGAKTLRIEAKYLSTMGITSCNALECNLVYLKVG